MALNERTYKFRPQMKSHHLNCFFLAVIVLSSTIIATGPLQDPDLWWHIKTGEIITTQKKFPTKDIFTFTAYGNPWIAYSWLPEIIFYFTSRLGYFVLIILRILLLTLISVVLYFIVEQLLKNPQFSAFGVFVGWGACYPVWELRPHIFSFLFLAIIVGIFVLRLGKIYDATSFLPVVFLLWANCHIYFAFGLFLFFLFVVLDCIFNHKRLDFRLLILLLLSVVATFVNPYGIKIYEQFFQLARHSWTWTWVMEMAKPYPWDSRVFAFWIYCVLLSVIIYFIRKKITVITIVFLLISFFYSITALRHIAIFPLVSLPFVALSLQDLTLPPPKVSSLAAKLFIAILSLVLVLRLVADYKKPIADSVPVKVAQFVKQKNLQGPIANYFDFGGYFIYSLWPKYKIFMDGRTQVFSDDFLQEQAVLLSDDVDVVGAKKIFKKYKVKTIIWQTDHPLTTKLNFPIIYRDEIATVFSCK